MSAWATVTWDVARTGGFVAYGLVTVSVALGLALSLHWRSRWWPRWATNDLHRYVTLLALIFTGIHTLAVWVDPFMAFTPAEVLLPLASHYRPLWIAFGIISSYLLVAIWLSERVQRVVGYPWWRRLHYLTFAIFGLATVHGIGTGSDTRTGWALLIYGASVLLVGGLLGVRLLWPYRHLRPHPWVALFGAAAVALLMAWTVVGPLRPGWNAAANNGHGSGARIALQSPGGSPVGSTALALPFTAYLRGTVQQRGGDDGFGERGPVTVGMNATLGGGGQGTLQVVLEGWPVDDGALAIRRTRVSLTGPGGAVCTGQLTSLQGGSMTGVCTDPAGTQVRLNIQVQAQGARRVQGTLRARVA